MQYIYDIFFLGGGWGAGRGNCATILVLKKMLNQNTDETNDVWYPSRFMKNGVLYTPFGAYTLLRGYVGSWNSSCCGEIKMKLIAIYIYRPSAKRKKGH